MAVAQRKIQQEKIKQQVLLWYTKNKRDLPWRNTINPYYILLSEIMLQQTQVPRVIHKYNLFLKQFPEVNDLAIVSKIVLLQVWSGLGYNRRALNLQKACKAIIELHNGVVPENKEQLKLLPGIGDYTANAILTFAFNKDVAVLDINIKRIYSRVYAITNHKEIQIIATNLLFLEKSRIWNNALMDIGSIHCRPNPICQGCPFSSICAWDKKGSRVEIKAGKQSTFIGSNRFYRGSILRFLTKANYTSQQLLKQLPLKFQDKQKLLIALQQLLKEGFIIKDKNKKIIIVK